MAAALIAPLIVYKLEEPIVTLGLPVAISGLITVGTLCVVAAYGGCCFGAGRLSSRRHTGGSRQIVLPSGSLVTVNGAD